MVINEIFYSLQGEGFLAGVPSVFIRLAGCPLRCRWCDTKYAWSKEAGQQYSTDQINQAVENWPCRYVIITGGEPMVEPDLTQLAGELRAAGKHITIETAGIAYVPDIPCDLLSISPKMSNSLPDDVKLADIHKDSRLDLAVLGELIDNYNHQLKFVVESVNDLAEIQELLDKIANVDAGKVMLMPQATTREEYLTKSTIVADMCKLVGFTFSQRLQVLLWNNERGK